MAYLRKFMTVVLLLSLFGVPSFAQESHNMSADDLPKFLISNIQNNERIEIVYLSDKPSHKYGEIIFRPAHVTIPEIGEKVLSWTEMASLDRYIEALVNIDPKAEACTTHATYVMKLFRNDEEVVRRVISDTSCGSNRDAMTFFSLRERVYYQTESAILIK